MKPINFIGTAVLALLLAGAGLQSASAQPGNVTGNSSEQTQGGRANSPGQQQKSSSAQNKATQNKQKKKAETAQVGAGTDNETTTGFSGPGHGGPKGPQKPAASMCDSYHGDAHKACLQTVLRATPNQNTNSKANSKGG